MGPRPALKTWFILYYHSQSYSHSTPCIMKTTTATFAILSSLSALSTLVEAFIYPSNPVGATVWKPNTNVTIIWSEDKLAPLLSSNPVFDIFLMTGSDDHQMKLATIAADVKGGTTNSVKYQVPYISPPGQSKWCITP